jgi:hypothetical protein
MRLPDYTGSGLVNLISEIELRMTGTAPMGGMTDSGAVPEASGYVLVLIDGLGTSQLEHPAAGGLGGAMGGNLTAGFPTTTTSSLATLVTGLPPSGHGIIGHILWLPGMAEAVNVLKWVTPQGRPVPHDYRRVLPSPNLWERLSAAGIEPVTVQPGPFMGSPLSQMLYRGCRYEPAWTVDELVRATLDLARPGRLVFTYYPDVDVAAHVSGQASREYREALTEAAAIWEALSERLPPEIGLVGTADHGHLDYLAEGKLLIRDPGYDVLRFYGDSRSTWVSGPLDRIHELAGSTGARLVKPDEFRPWLGPGPEHPELTARLPDRLLLAPPGRLLLPRGFDKRLIGYHGGLAPEEVEVPLLVR